MISYTTSLNTIFLLKVSGVLLIITTILLLYCSGNLYNIHAFLLENELETKNWLLGYRHPMTIEERVEYYLTPKWYAHFKESMENNLPNNPSNIYINVSLFNSDIINNSMKLLMDNYILVSEKILGDYIRMNNQCEFYCRDPFVLLKLPAMKKCKYHNLTKQYVMQFNDRSLNVRDYPSGIPVFKKARFMNEENALLLKLNSGRHFGFYSKIEKNDIPWEEKDNMILWRGSMTGYHGHVRYTVVNKYFKYYEKRNEMNATVDIAFMNKIQNYVEWRIARMNAGKLRRRKIAFTKMLQSKYLVSIPGNDVGTNLGWILFSNSVPFLFRLPLEESGYEAEAWLMHGLLQPYVHYIPFTVNNDTDDSLMKGFEFCESHSENCSQIAQNGKQWMMQFKDKEREEEIQTKMLVLYCHSVHVI